MTVQRSQPLLELDNINTFYGPSQALFDVSLEISQGEVVALLGRNGVGKTTTIRSIMGVTPPKRGKIRHKGEEIQGMVPNEIRKRGISWVPEDRRVFPNLTVEANIEVAASVGENSGVTEVYKRFPRLDERRDQKAGTLSGGEQQMLAIARAIVGPPTELLLLDEPTEGLAPKIVETVEDIIVSLIEDDVTILLVEQKADTALELADRAYILSQGQIQLQSDADELRRDQDIIEKHLGAK